jgi:hypothetical protein
VKSTHEANGGDMSDDKRDKPVPLSDVRATYDAGRSGPKRLELHDKEVAELRINLRFAMDQREQVRKAGRLDAVATRDVEIAEYKDRLREPGEKV